MMDEDNGISMFDEDGNEINFQVLANKKDGEDLYLLAEEIEEDEEDVLIFKCVGDGSDEMIFELIDEEHKSFKTALKLFKEDFEALDIEYE